MPPPLAILHAIAADPEAGQLSMRDLQVISIICHEGTPPFGCTSVAIGARLEISANAMTRVRHRLETKGLITHTADPMNLRRVVFVPTARARALDKRVRAMFLDREAAA